MPQDFPLSLTIGNPFAVHNLLPRDHINIGRCCESKWSHPTDYEKGNY